MTMVKHASVRKREPTLLITVALLGCLVIFCLEFNKISRDKNEGYGKVYNNIEDVRSLMSFDAILVLGGGVPSSLYEPPIYVQLRCDDAAAIRGSSDTPILTLSAGTAHLPQLLTQDGLPVWESTSSAAYLQKKHGIQTNLYLETTSYDTIGNAFFARLSHTDIMGWRKLLIITNEFHMDRTKAIFDWIFGIDNSRHHQYQLTYYASRDVGLSEEALQARKEHEQRSAKTVRTILSPKYRTMKELWKFVNENHDLYTADKLIAGATQVSDVRNDALKASYGAGAGK